MRRPPTIQPATWAKQVSPGESLQQRRKEGSRVRIVCRPHHNNIALHNTSLDYGIVLPIPHMVMPY